MAHMVKSGQLRENMTKIVFCGQIRVDETKLEKNNNFLISYLVNVSFDLGPIMARHDFLLARRVILSNV